MLRWSLLGTLSLLVVAAAEGGNARPCLAASTLASSPARRSTLSFARPKPRLVSQELALPDNPREAALLEDAADGRLDEHSLLAAALIAGGAESQTIIAAQQRIFDWANELRKADSPHASDRHRAQAILKFLHERVLTGEYELTCSDLGRALDEGRYNCVNSTILFNALAEELGLSVIAVECPAHVYSVVLSHLGEIDVETTCPEWFELEHKPREQRATLAAKTGASTAGQRWEGPRRRIDAAGLTALLYYNRGVDMLEQHRFSSAVAANSKALRLDPHNAQAHGNLLAAINNWSLAAAEKGEHEVAIRILDAGLELAPKHELFHANYLALHQQWFHKLSAAGRDDAVLALLQHARQMLPEQTYWGQVESATRRRMGESVR